MSREQRVISLHAAHCTVSSMRLQKRLLICERMFEALARSSLDGVRTRKRVSQNSCSIDGEKNDKSASPVDNFARLGARAGLSFAFAFLKKTWRCGEDTELCTDVLQDTLFALQSLPPSLLYDNSKVNKLNILLTFDYCALG